MKWSRIAAISALATAAVLMLRRASAMPAVRPRNAPPLGTSDPTSLQRAVEAIAHTDRARSGLHLLTQGGDAFAARALLARAAERTLDVQYYIVRRDVSGTLLLGELLAAAGRGVRVRLLVDDNGISGIDEWLATLETCPRIEVRVFNPSRIRRPKLLGYALHFRRLNRRMHNKSFTADGVVTVVGGRNVGDEYFGARPTGLFWDLDVFAVGLAAADVTAQFERFWNSASAYPISDLVGRPSDTRRAVVQAVLSEANRSGEAQSYLAAIRSLSIVRQLLDRTLPLEWAKVRLVTDMPEKVLDQGLGPGNLSDSLKEAMGTPEHEVGIVSAYFVPSASAVKAFADLVGRGVAVKIFTNALQSTDVPLVHAAYSRHRADLLKFGIELFEMKGAAGASPEPDRDDALDLRVSGYGLLPNRESGLHAKTFTVDRTRLFIGSFNFDPRSVQLNTELGFVIESPALAARVQDAFERVIPERAYRLGLSPSGSMRWSESRGTDTVHHAVEPGTSVLKRAMLWLASRLPIERLV